MKLRPTWLRRRLAHAALTAIMSLGALTPHIAPLRAATDGGGYGTYGHNSLRLGDLVWFDTNNDGKYTNDEPGLPGISIELYREGQTPGIDSPLKTTQTDENGYYWFNRLAAGRYFVYLPKLPSSLLQVTPLDNDASNGKNGRNRGTQAGGTGQPVKSIVFDVQPGQGPTNDGDDANGYLIVDIGLWCPPAQGGALQLGDQVFRDNNNNGRRDPDEGGVNGVTVELFGEGQTPGIDQPLATDITKQGGYYTFHNVAAGRYFVYLPYPPKACSTVSSLTFGNDDGKNNRNRGNQNGAGQPIKSIVMTLDANDGVTDDGDIAGGNLTFDIGLVCVPLAQLGDKVFEDNNGNGLQDLGEPGIANATVKLLDGAGNVLQETTTDDSGLYQFGCLTPGVPYKVLVILPGGYTFTTKTGNLNDSNNSDVDVNNGMTDPLTLNAGETNNNVDAGAYRPVRIGNFVWRDLNGNGIYDDGDPSVIGVNNVTVRLYNATNDALVATTTTDANGVYGFANLRPGNYYVIFDLNTIPAGLMVTTANVGGDDTIDSDANINTGRTANTGVIVSGGEDLTLDMGLKVVPVATATHTPTNTPVPQPSTYTLGNLVWRDNDNNGQVDAGEPGINGVEVGLWNVDTSAIVSTQLTSGGGFYQFTNLPAGRYIVFIRAEVLAGALAGLAPSTSFDGVPDNNEDNDNNGKLYPDESGQVRSNLITLGPGASEPTGAGFVNQTLDFGFAPVNVPTATPGTPTATATATPTNTPAAPTNTPTPTGTVQVFTLGDKVFEDLNHNGLQDAGEPGINGVTVTLQSANAVIVTVTDANGFYQFTNLTAGVPYTVTFTRPNGYQSTIKSGDVNEVLNSDADPITGIVSGIVLTQNNPNIDAGFWRPASLGNFVWEDRNGNGTQEDSEPGIVGATVRLLNGAGGLISTTTTNAAGFYQFSNLPKGDYIVEFVTPSSYMATVKLNENGNDTVDSDADQGTGRTGIITLDPGEDDPSNDAGFYRPASLGDRLWDDRNKNGIQDLGEPGIGGARVTLYDAAGNEIASTTTDSSGLYQFSNLPPGRYSVGFERPRGGYVFTGQFQGANTGADSDVDVNSGRTPLITLVSGENNPTIDAGLYVPEPDAVTLASFTAQNDKTSIKVKWVTTAEINTLGFRLRRAAISPAGGSVSLPDLHAGSVIVTAQMILAKGRGQGGATYEFVDTTAQPGLRYVYWLVETELDGNELEYGPTAPSGMGAARIFLPLLTNSAKKK